MASLIEEQDLITGGNIAAQYLRERSKRAVVRFAVYVANGNNAGVNPPKTPADALAWAVNVMTNPQGVSNSEVDLLMPFILADGNYAGPETGNDQLEAIVQAAIRNHRF